MGDERELERRLFVEVELIAEDSECISEDREDRVESVIFSENAQRRFSHRSKQFCPRLSSTRVEIDRAVNDTTIRFIEGRNYIINLRIPPRSIP